MKLKIALWGAFLLGSVVHWLIRGDSARRNGTAASLKIWLETYWVVLVARTVIAGGIFWAWVSGVSPSPIFKLLGWDMGPDPLIPLNGPTALFFGVFSDIVLEYFCDKIPMFKREVPQFPSSASVAAAATGAKVPLILLALVLLPGMARAQMRLSSTTYLDTSCVPGDAKIEGNNVYFCEDARRLWSQAGPTGPTQDDLDALFSAWGHHQAGLTITFQNGPKGFMRLFCMFWCVPRLETPADYTTWNWGRVLSWPDPPDGAASARWPGQPKGCNVVNFQRTGNAIRAGCIGPEGTVFEPAIPPGGFRSFLAGLAVDPRAKVIP